MLWHHDLGRRRHERFRVGLGLGLRLWFRLGLRLVLLPSELVEAGLRVGLLAREPSIFGFDACGLAADALLFGHRVGANLAEIETETTPDERDRRQHEPDHAPTQAAPVAVAREGREPLLVLLRELGLFFSSLG